LTGDGGDDLWLTLERLGYQSGHFVVRCRNCGCRQMVAYRPPSAPLPRCRVCPDGATELISSRALMQHKRPGWPRRRKDNAASSRLDAGEDPS
jgi:hypothetical protein